MSKKLYEVLGIKSAASKSDIKSAYRKLAKKLHPDLNPGNQSAENKFQKVTAAYDILGDADKRARYDRGEIDEHGAEKPETRYYRQYADTDDVHAYNSTAGYEDFADLGDIFSDLYRRQKQTERMRSAGGGFGSIPISGADVRYHMTVEFLEAAKGAKKRVTMADGAILDVTIPQGINEDQTIRLKGKGQPGVNGGPPGDALIMIAIRPHPIFKRKGYKIEMTLPITLYEAALGAKIKVPTIWGPVVVSIPTASNTGKVLRLKGKGVRKSGGPKGDQLATLEVMFPEKIDKQLNTFLDEWKQDHTYDPREKLEGASNV